MTAVLRPFQQYFNHIRTMGKSVIAQGSTFSEATFWSDIISPPADIRAQTYDPMSGTLTTLPGGLKA